MNARVGYPGGKGKGGPPGGVTTRTQVEEKATALSYDLVVTVGDPFEECLEFSWELVKKSPSAKATKLRKSTAMLALNLAKAPESVCKPPQDATVKKVDCGADMNACVQNMPERRRFFISVVGTFEDGSQAQSEWVHARTLDPEEREKHLSNIDPLDKPRMNCKNCPCMCYVAQRWTQFTATSLRCRRCGCKYDSHVAVDVTEILQQRETKAKETYKREIVSLPRDAIAWDDRENTLWFLTDGQVHPRMLVGAGRSTPAEDAKIPQGGYHGISGKKGRVTVVTPTTESRQIFHQNLWMCFEGQKWPDKELVVVETYYQNSSTFFEELALKDTRLTYVRFKVPPGGDWSIGLKRNIGAHLATGEYIANFDDDDIYGPTYLKTMVGQLELRKAQAITLSSWYVYDGTTSKWSFCDTIAWGLAQGMDENAQDVRNWAYGYGFSYLNRRSASLEVPYDDRNMGEDYAFVTKLQKFKTDKSVQLLHDDFGICVHIQHGGNTSNAFPIREVHKSEVGRLEVAEMARVIDKSIKVQNTKLQSILVATPTQKVTSQSASGITVEQFLEKLETQLPGVSKMKVHVVPPPGQASQEERIEISAKVLGVEFLIKTLAATRPELQRPEVATRRGKLMLERVKSAMRSEDRIPLLATNVWLAHPEAGAEAERHDVKALQLDSGLEKEPKKVNIVEVTVRATEAKDLIAGKVRGFKAMLLEGDTMKTLKDLLETDLLKDARFLVTNSKPGEEKPLQDWEAVPQKLLITAFKSKRTFYVRFTKSQCLKNLLMMKAYLVRPESQLRLDQLEVEARGSEQTFRTNLSQLLMSEVYPAVFRHYGAEVDGVQSVWSVMAGMHYVNSERYLLLQQFEVEVLLRNKTTVVGLISELREFHKICPKNIQAWLEGGKPVKEAFLPVGVEEYYNSVVLAGVAG